MIQPWDTAAKKTLKLRGFSKNSWDTEGTRTGNGVSLFSYTKYIWHKQYNYTSTSLSLSWGCKNKGSSQMDEVLAQPIPKGQTVVKHWRCTTTKQQQISDFILRLIHPTITELSGVFGMKSRFKATWITLHTNLAMEQLKNKWSIDLEPPQKQQSPEPCQFLF